MKTKPLIEGNPLKHRVSMELPGNDLALLQAMADERGVSLSSVLREAIRAGVEEDKSKGRGETTCFLISKEDWAHISVAAKVRRSNPTTTIRQYVELYVERVK